MRVLVLPLTLVFPLARIVYDLDVAPTNEFMFMIDVVVGWHATSWNTTPALSPDLMRRLAKLNLPIWFDVYLFGSEEKE